MNTLHLLSNAHMRWVTHDTNGRFTMADSCRQGTAGGGGGTIAQQGTGDQGLAWGSGSVPVISSQVLAHMATSSLTCNHVTVYALL